MTFSTLPGCTTKDEVTSGIEWHVCLNKRVEGGGLGDHFLLNAHTSINVATQDQGEERYSNRGSIVCLVCVGGWMPHLEEVLYSYNNAHYLKVNRPMTKQWYTCPANPNPQDISLMTTTEQNHAINYSFRYIIGIYKYQTWDHLE